jgi:hypothetical protein
VVVGVWSLGGALVVGLLSAGWPGPAAFAAQTAAAEASHPRPEPAQPQATAVPPEQAAKPVGRHRITTTSVTPDRP